MADEGGNTTIIIKKIKKAGHGAHGGAWKVAYADFVTAMMAFFLVMWIVAMSQETKEGIQQYFNDPLQYLTGSESLFQGLFSSDKGAQMASASKKGGVVDSSKAGGISRVHLLAKELEYGLTTFKGDIQAFKVFPDKIQFAITAQSLFNPSSALLKPESEALLSKVANMLKTMNSNLMIEAHSDDLPPENPEYPTNWELTSARAATVARYFIEGHSFDPTRITAMAAAEFRPTADNSTPEGRAQNRRIDIYIIPDRDRRTNFRSPASEEIPPSPGQ
jgi:chemotaxis protein MotB